MSFYVMVDRPAIYVIGKRGIKHTNKPRWEHKTKEEAIRECQRLTRKTKSRVLVLEVVHEEIYQKEPEK